MDQSSGFNNQNNSFNRSTLSVTDPDIDWSVFENADRYLLRDDSAWITRLSKDFWWNLERISEMTTTGGNPTQQMISTKTFPQPINNTSARKIVGQHSTITRPKTNNIPEKINYDKDIEYNPFQSKISFDNNIWTNYFQQAIPWQ